MKKRRLSNGESNDTTNSEEAKRLRYGLLRSAFGAEDRVDESNWLTGTLIDLMLWKFAELYPECGRGQSEEEINDQIDQQAITSFRKQLQLQLQARASDDKEGGQEFSDDEREV
ncbi:hypothetical protein BBO99_00003349 [Phytophthora kernoviae]|uniref:Uncharacterized protein n=2 Tax=Phytophthora kernoviae TaxID=325452 RepID=A0A3R7HYN8_9STRA|nr:hypothetical protein G195_003664 [Phytophthora kernoviae 00238/432]KAG2528208.1 hypothetical protein JM16_002976 [Phytophthora kernoviae]KAG2529869.1 hypothetical protein JM18_002663 [Phytophthora kernoviae]RLN21470.1 hypothetical protein BBI17_003407 [Phytophthora kernoviae]RLN81874.1 hypothetical protein BBO99_00003349 [Phytophthora kernoviae]